MNDYTAIAITLVDHALLETSADAEKARQGLPFAMSALFEKVSNKVRTVASDAGHPDHISQLCADDAKSRLWAAAFTYLHAIQKNEENFLIPLEIWRGDAAQLGQALARKLWHRRWRMIARQSASPRR